MKELDKSRQEREDKGNSATARLTWAREKCKDNRLVKVVSQLNFSLGKVVESILIWSFIYVCLAI